MALWTLNHSYSVDDRILNNQHSIFVGMLNEIRDTVAGEQPAEAVAKRLRALASDICNHLALMEAMMTFTRFPHINEHRACHRELARRLREFAARCEQGDRSMQAQLLSFVQESLDSQMRKQEQELGPWLHAHATNSAAGLPEMSRS